MEAEEDVEPFIGEIRMMAFDYAPKGWAKCDGRLLAISKYNDLYNLYGTTYGGDGRTTFGLPNLAGRTPMHAGDGPGLNPVVLGQWAGSNTHTLKVSELPSHMHTSMATKSPGTSINPANMVWAADSSAADKTYADPLVMSSSPGSLVPNAFGYMHPATAGSTGGGYSYSIDNPFLGINFCCALQGRTPPKK